MKVTIRRQLSSDEGVFGVLETEDGFKCFTGELPWRNNAIGVSCIPAGTYKVAMAWSPKHERNVYHVQGVPGRTVVEIHSANLMGDVEKGYLCQLEGCIAPGKNIDVFRADTFPNMTRPQRGIVHSKEAQAELEAHLESQPFDLEIVWNEDKA